MHRPLSLKTIGILGGSSNVATMEYYRFLNDGVNARLGGWDIAETLIVGMNFGNIEAMVREGDWDGLTRYMTGKVEALVKGGADMILGVSNTLHKPLEPIMAGMPIPLLHIATPTGEAMQKAGITRAALFGTKPVMETDYMKDRWLADFGITVVSPTEEEQVDIDRIIFDELVKGVFQETSRQRYLEIAARMRREDGAEGLILGCTEIFLLIDQPHMPDFPMFNTAKLHCEAAVEMALGG